MSRCLPGPPNGKTPFKRNQRLRRRKMEQNFEKRKDSAEGAITPEAIAAMRRRIGIVMPYDRPGHEYATLDGIRGYTEGVGELMKMAVEKGRKTRPTSRSGSAACMEATPAQSSFAIRSG
jgi:hypothetical protein